MEEEASSWFKWTCDTAGLFTFIITPNKSSSGAFDDLDFMVFELNDINDCFGKKLIRCVASSCEGLTGLSEVEIDSIEKINCLSTSNNFVKAINMAKGKSYALVINNFSLSGQGYNINFGGNGTVLGPCEVGNPTSTDDFFIEDLSIFPNPTNQYLNCVHTKSEDSQIKIINSNGKLMWQGIVSKNQSIDVSNFLAGIYFVQLVHNNTIESVKKMIKM
jgi:hypothetical protein